MREHGDETTGRDHVAALQGQPDRIVDLEPVPRELDEDPARPFQDELRQCGPGQLGGEYLTTTKELQSDPGGIGLHDLERLVEHALTLGRPPVLVERRVHVRCREQHARTRVGGCRAQRERVVECLRAVVTRRHDVRVDVDEPTWSGVLHR